MKKKIFLSFLLVMIIASLTITVNAGVIDKIMSQAGGFKGTSQAIGTKLSSFIKNDVVPIIGLIGNLVFAGVTVILGMKYIWSSAEGKSEVLESLPGFVLAVTFFYLGESLVNWISGSSLGTIANANNWNTVKNAIWGIIYIVAQYGSFAGILFLGLKYMFASAEGKASIKANFGVLAIGITFVFCATRVVNFIVAMSKQVIQ